jgi:molybdopterin-guanine dinucleotide biosynthesis protein A
MRYPYTTWNDLDRTLEAFRYARRSLLVVMAAALPFAAWDAVSPTGASIAPDTVEVQTVKSVGQAHPAPLVLPVQHVEAADECVGTRTRRTDDAKV